MGLWQSSLLGTCNLVRLISLKWLLRAVLPHFWDIYSLVLSLCCEPFLSWCLECTIIWGMGAFLNTAIFGPLWSSRIREVGAGWRAYLEAQEVLG